MKTIILLRHAEAEKGAAETPDMARPLTPAGTEDARQIGLRLVWHYRPDAILCSPSRRTRDTLAEIERAYRTASVALPSARWEPSLYASSPGEILALLQGLPEKNTCALLVGHNPEFHELARGLAAAGPPEDRKRLALRFSPGTAAVLSGPLPWAEWGREGLMLRELLRPEAD